MEISKIKTVLIATAIGGCIAVCGISGCFMEETQPTKVELHIDKPKQLNKDFIQNWNDTVISLNLNKKLYNELILDNIEKLNKIFSKINKSIQYQKCNKNKALYIPIVEYIKFLDKYKNKPIFTQNDKNIEEKILKFLHTQYIDKKSIKNLTYLLSFKQFFIAHKEEFYKKGFTRNITNFDEYAKILKRCK